MMMDRRRVLIIAAVAQLIIQLVANMTVIALPIISEDLNFTAETTLWVNLIYLMSFVAFSLPFAKIISQYGIKKCMKISLITFIISIFLSVFAFGSTVFLIARLLQGLTSASLAVGIYVMIVEEFSDAELGSALGIVASSGYVGMLIAPSFMGFLIVYYNWKFAFLILIPIVLILLYLLSKVDHEWIGEKKPINITGSFFYIIMMVLFTYSITELDEMGFISLIISFILFILFIRYERKSGEPLFNLGLFRDVRYLIGNYAAMVTYFTTTIAISALSFHMLYELNFEEHILSFILMISPVLMIIMSNFSGKLSNSIDPRIISAVALIFIFMAMVMFSLIAHISFELIVLACIFQGIGNGLFSAPNNKYVLTLVGPDDLADASSVLSTSKEFGKILGNSIYALIFSIFMGSMALGSDNIGRALIRSSNLMMSICAVMALSGVILLFYSKYKFDIQINRKTVELFKSIMPERIKKFM